MRFFIFVQVVDPNFLDFQVPRSPNSQISRFQISKIPEIWLGPRLGPRFPAWARAWAWAWAQTPPAPAPPPDEFSDLNLTPLPTHSPPRMFCSVKKSAGFLLSRLIFFRSQHSKGSLFDVICLAHHFTSSACHPWTSRWPPGSQQKKRPKTDVGMHRFRLGSSKAAST